MTCPRDERGWRIPGAGTKSRAIYDLMVRGHTTDFIARSVGGSPVAVSVLIWQISHPDKNAEQKRAYYQTVKRREASALEPSV